MLTPIVECWAEDLLSNKELIVTNYFNLSGRARCRPSLHSPHSSMVLSSHCRHEIKISSLDSLQNILMDSISLSQKRSNSFLKVNRRHRTLVSPSSLTALDFHISKNSSDNLFSSFFFSIQLNVLMVSRNNSCSSCIVRNILASEWKFGTRCLLLLLPNVSLSGRKLSLFEKVLQAYYYYKCNLGPRHLMLSDHRNLPPKEFMCTTHKISKNIKSSSKTRKFVWVNFA